MIAFRDGRAQELGLDLIVHVNQDGLARGISPMTHGSEIHTDVMKTQALRQALDRHRFDAAIGGARRDEETSRAKERVVLAPQRPSSLGPEAPAARAVAALQYAQAAAARACASSRCPIGPSSTSGSTSTQEQIPIVPLYFAADRPVVGATAC